MDESGNGDPGAPLLVGAVAVANEFGALDAAMEELYRMWSVQEARFGDSVSFGEFRERGFHGGQMPLEIQLALIAFLANRLDYKVFILTSDRSRVADVDETQRLVLMYTLLLTDIVIRFRRHSHVRIRVEDNDQLRPHLSNIVKLVEERAKSKSAAPVEAALSIEMVPKNEPMTLSIIDFYMRVVVRWLRTGSSRDHGLSEYRNFAALEPSISLLKSLETGVLSNRAARLAL